MTFEEIYKRIIPLWGSEINFADAKIVPNESETPGFHSKVLSKLWNDAEYKTNKSGEFDSLMVWTMFQVFHWNARKLFDKGVMSFDPRAISKAEIEKRYFENLNEEGYEKELEKYIRDFVE